MFISTSYCYRQISTSRWTMSGHLSGEEQFCSHLEPPSHLSFPNFLNSYHTQLTFFSPHPFFLPSHLQSSFSFHISFSHQWCLAAKSRGPSAVLPLRGRDLLTTPPSTSTLLETCSGSWHLWGNIFHLSSSSSSFLTGFFHSLQCGRYFPRMTPWSFLCILPPFLGGWSNCRPSVITSVHISSK